MKLTTDIKPRRDGKLTAKTPDGTEYKFEDDGDGRLVADIKNEDHVSFLLDSGNFYPLDEAADLDTDEDEDGEGEGDGEGGEGGQDAAPIESNTPPKPARKAAAKPKKAK